MARKWFAAVVAAGVLTGLVRTPPPPAAAQEPGVKKQDVETAVERGLEFLKRDQKTGGRWEATGGQYPTAMTALAGMAFLMEGSNLREGKYHDQVRETVNWYLDPTRQNPQTGKIGAGGKNDIEEQRYMYGHGFSTMFLASVYGEERDQALRKRLEAMLKKAVEFICNAQTTKKHIGPGGREVTIGGWGYLSVKDLVESQQRTAFDEGSVTITQLQALRACRNAGIPVPKETIDRAVAYLEACTTPDGGIVYNYTGGHGGQPGRPALTAAALACGLSTGEFTKAGEIMRSANPPRGQDRPSVVRWFDNCRRTIPIMRDHAGRDRVGHEEYQMYYYAQAMYAIGDDKWGEMFPHEKKDDWLTWSKFKEVVYPYLIQAQDKLDGKWVGSGQWVQAPVFATAVNLAILQLDKGILPIYQR